MSELTSKSQRLDALLEQLSSLSIAGDLQGASKVLREAATLDPEDDRVKAAWSQLQTSDSRDHELIHSLGKYLSEHRESDGIAAVQAAKSSYINSEDVNRALELIFDAKDDNSQTVEEVLVRLLSSQNGKRAAIPLIRDREKSIFERFAGLPSGAALYEVVNLILDASIWDSEEARRERSHDLFRLMLNELKKPSAPLETLMRCIAKFLAVDAKEFEPIVTSSDFTRILSFLDIRKPFALQSQATLAAAKLLEVNPDQDKAQGALKDFVVSRIRSGNTNELILAFSTAAAMFPVLTAMAANLFLTEGFVTDVVKLAQNSQDSSLLLAVLELLSAACIDKACRQSISNTCTPWLKGVVQVNDRNAATAALILSKTAEDGKKDSLNDLVALFKETLKVNSNEQTLQSSIEGLAFSSIQPSIKEALVNDDQFLKNLIRTINAHFEKKTLLFGGLTIFHNLTVYLPELSAEERRMNDLKAYANQSKPTAPDPLNSEQRVTKRCKVVIDSGFVPLLVKCQRQASASPNFLKLTTDIIISLTHEPKLRGKLAQLGLFATVIQMANLKASEDQTLLWTKRQSALALARFVIPIDPALLFGTNTKRDVRLAIRPLSMLLDSPEANDPVFSNRTAIDHRPTFDALRALANLAVLSPATTKLVVEQCFEKIVELLWSRISAICQAATECILNMTTDWTAVSKFVAKEAMAQNRLKLLWALTGAEAIGTRTAATAALSHILTASEGVAAFLNIQSGVEGIVEILEDEHSGMRVRAATCVYSLVADESIAGKDARKRVNAKSGKTLLLNLDVPEEYRDMVYDAVKCLETDKGLSADG